MIATCPTCGGMVPAVCDEAARAALLGVRPDEVTAPMLDAASKAVGLTRDDLSFAPEKCGGKEAAVRAAVAAQVEAYAEEKP